MDVINSLQWRYATKKFDTNQKLSKDKLEILKQAFNLTATSFGMQTIKMFIIEDEVIRKSLVPHAFNQQQVWEASHLLVLCINEDVVDSDVDDHFDNVSNIRQTPESILSPYRTDLKTMMQSMTKEQRQEWSIKQIYIVLGTLMTVCAVEGIDSCPMEGFVAERFDTILKLKDENLKSVLLLPVGYRHKNDMFADFKKVRKQLKDTILEL